MRSHLYYLSALLGSAAVALSARAELPLPAATVGRPAVRSWNVRQTPVVDVVKRVKDAVVNIHSERTVRAPASEELFSLAPSQNRVNGMGTGIVIDPRGYIITNHHVVEDVSLLRVRLSDGTTLSARVVGRDAENDLALLKIDPPRALPVMPLGTAKDVQVGETVVAIGNAYGYDHTVTVGCVSAIGRDVTLNKDVRYRSLIQTDAAINPGNSGGPLINLSGELIGVNVAIRAGAQGIGFAIPVDTMIRVGSSMLSRVPGRQATAPLGLVLSDEVRRSATDRRVMVDSVSVGAASKAGVQKGDELVKMGDQTIASSLDVQRALLGRESGQRLAVVVRRGGVEKSLNLTLEASAYGASGTLTSNLTSASAAKIWKSLGLSLSPISDTATLTRKHPQLHGGLSIAEVRSSSPADKAGLKVGDILVGLHQWEMLSVDNVLYVLNHPNKATFSPLRFYILRSGSLHRGWLTLGE